MASDEDPTTEDPTTIVWLRHDLRVADNPALDAAVRGGGTVLPVFIWAPEEEGAWAPGGASRWWLHHALEALDAELRQRGNRLLVAELQKASAGATTALSTSGAVLAALAATSGARRVCWNRRYEPAIVTRDTAIKQALTGSGLEVQTFNAQLLHEPWTLRTQTGQPFRVFTPFWRASLAAPEPPAPLPAPRRIPAPAPARGQEHEQQHERAHERARVGRASRPARHIPDAGFARRPGDAPLAAVLRPDVASLGLLPTVDWAAGLRAIWTPGESTARRRLEAFLPQALGAYAQARDAPGEPGTSRLSAHLHFGEIGPRQIWWAVREALDTHPIAGAVARAGSAPGREGAETAGAEAFLRELGWREFSHHVLFHFPRTPTEPLRPEFARFPWRTDAADDLRAWQRGRTGYPLVDAGMRELWQTGTMHNRVRMVVGSFLVKHLLLPWQAGARWFWDTLVDADLAQNTLGWQWTAGCGADAAPYFRVFNPVLQGQKFDPRGAYVRRFVPELGRLPDAHLHAPWRCPEAERLALGIRLGVDYPWPMVDHAAARSRALAAFAAL